MTEGRTELLYAAFRERVEYHLLSALVRGKATLGRGDASAQNALAQLEARLKAVGRWIRVHGFVDVATLQKLFSVWEGSHCVGHMMCSDAFPGI